jgi:hypothetical protein
LTTLSTTSVFSDGLMLDIARSRTESAIPYTKASTSVHVLLLRNSWWSSGLNILLDGRMYSCPSNCGGSGSDGVGGGGADGASRVEARLRGTSFGSLLLRSGGGEGISGCVMVSCNCVGCYCLSVSRCMRALESSNAGSMGGPQIRTNVIHYPEHHGIY